MTRTASIRITGLCVWNCGLPCLRRRQSVLCRDPAIRRGQLAPAGYTLLIASTNKQIEREITLLGMLASPHRAAGRLVYSPGR